MKSNFISEAYKPEEKLIFNYLILRDALSRVLQEQKFEKETEVLLYKIYKKFQANASDLIILYNRIPNVLKLNQLTQDISDETDSILWDSGLQKPLLAEKEAMNALAKFMADLEVSYLDDSEKYINSIPGFNWDIKSFKKVFQQIEEKGANYDNEHVGSAE